MTIEITRPEVEALIRQRIESGRFASAEDVILQALRSFDPERPSGAALVAAMQASPYPDADVEPPRDRMPVRDVPI
jgi:Arc/MetJ-type ribon-helix-helix transcriptional regulator